jgi:hypothetical protein
MVGYKKNLSKDDSGLVSARPRSERPRVEPFASYPFEGDSAFSLLNQRELYL